MMIMIMIMIMMIIIIIIIIIIGLTDRVGSEVTRQTRFRKANCLDPERQQTALNKIPNFFFVFPTNPLLAKGKVHPRTDHEGL
jgi:hypothetical protein